MNRKAMNILAEGGELAGAGHVAEDLHPCARGVQSGQEHASERWRCKLRV